MIPVMPSFSTEIHLPPKFKLESPIAPNHRPPAQKNHSQDQVPKNASELMRQIKLLEATGGSTPKAQRQVNRQRRLELSREALERRIMSGEDYTFTEEGMRRMRLLEDRIKMEDEDISAALIEKQEKELKANAFREKLRKEAEERQAREKFELAERKRLAQERRQKVVESLRLKKEEEEKRIRDSEELRIRQKELELRAQKDEAEAVQVDRKRMLAEDQLSHMYEKEFMEEVTHQQKRKKQLANLADWEAAQRRKDEADRAEQSSRLAELEAKKQRLIEMKKLQDSNRDSSQRALTQAKEESTRLAKQMRIQNKAKFVSRIIKKGQAPLDTDKPADLISRMNSGILPQQNEVVADVAVPSDFTEKINAVTSESELRTLQKTLMSEKRNIRISRRNRPQETVTADDGHADDVADLRAKQIEAEERAIENRIKAIVQKEEPELKEAASTLNLFGSTVTRTVNRDIYQKAEHLLRDTQEICSLLQGPQSLRDNHTRRARLLEMEMMDLLRNIPANDDAVGYRRKIQIADAMLKQALAMVQTADLDREPNVPSEAASPAAFEAEPTSRVLAPPSPAVHLKLRLAPSESCQANNSDSVKDPGRTVNPLGNVGDTAQKSILSQWLESSRKSAENSSILVSQTRADVLGNSPTGDPLKPAPQCNCSELIHHPRESHAPTTTVPDTVMEDHQQSNQDKADVNESYQMITDVKDANMIINIDELSDVNKPNAVSRTSIRLAPLHLSPRLLAAISTDDVHSHGDVSPRRPSLVPSDRHPRRHSVKKKRKSGQIDATDSTPVIDREAQILSEPPPADARARVFPPINVDDVIPINMDDVPPSVVQLSASSFADASDEPSPEGSSLQPPSIIEAPVDNSDETDDIGMEEDSLFDIDLDMGDRPDVDFETLPGWDECLHTTMASAAHHAAFYGYVNILEALGRYFDVFVQDEKGRTPLFYAALRNHLECVAVLVSIDAQWIDVGDVRGDTPLHAAAISDGVEVLNFLLSCECIPDTSNNFGYTAAHLAKTSEALQILHEAGATLYCMDAQSRLPLWIACGDGREECVRYLCAHTPTEFLLWPDVEGNSCLHAASMKGHHEVVEIVCQWIAKASDYSITNRKSYTCSHVASTGQVLKSLYENGADLWVTDPKGRYPLFIAAFHGRVDCVSILLELAMSQPEMRADMEAKIRACDQQGDTALHAACLCGNLQCAVLLLYFMDDTPNNKGLTPSQLADRAGHQQLAALVQRVNNQKRDNISPVQIFGCSFDGLSAVMLYYGSRWTKLYDHATDRLYYFDRATGVSDWSRPDTYDELPAEEVKADKVREFLIMFFTKYNPDSICTVDELIMTYKKNYNHLFLTLAEKYDVQDMSLFSTISDIDNLK